MEINYTIYYTSAGNLRLDINPVDINLYPFIHDAILSIDGVNGKAQRDSIIERGNVRTVLPYEVEVSFGRSLIIGHKAVNMISQATGQVQLAVNIRLKDSAGLYVTPDIIRNVITVMRPPVRSAMQDVEDLVVDAERDIANIPWYALVGMCVGGIFIVALMVSAVRRVAKSINQIRERRAKHSTQYVNVQLVDNELPQRKLAVCQAAVDMGWINAPRVYTKV